MSPLSKFPPADFEEFFRALDRELRRPLTVTVIGGAAIGLKYDPRHATSDIDLTPISDAEFWKAVDRARATHPVPYRRSPSTRLRTTTSRAVRRCPSMGSSG